MHIAGLILTLVFVPFLMAFIDFITLVRARFIKPHHIKDDHPDDHKHDFTILVPIFGDIKYLKNVENLSKYGSRVVLCSTRRESDTFNRDIERLAKKHNFRIYRSEVKLFTAKGKPNPWRLFRNTLHKSNDNPGVTSDARDEIIKDSFDHVNTEYCIFIDGDITTAEHLGKLVRLMIEKEYDIASVRVLASKTDTVMEKLQSLEYELAMDSRRIYPWLTSGAGMIAKTEVITLCVIILCFLVAVTSRLVN